VWNAFAQSFAGLQKLTSCAVDKSRSCSRLTPPIKQAANTRDEKQLDKQLQAARRSPAASKPQVPGQAGERNKEKPNHYKGHVRHGDVGVVGLRRAANVAGHQQQKCNRRCPEQCTPSK